MGLNQLLYLEIHCIDAILMGLLLASQHRALSVQTDHNQFRLMCWVVLCVSVVDSLYCVAEGNAAAWAVPLNAWSNAAYYVCTTFMALLWLSYVESKLAFPQEKLRRHFVLLLIPTLLTALVALLSPFTGWMFCIEAGSVFHRGSLYFLQAMISYLCMGIATLEAVWAAVHSTGALRRDAIYLSCFVVLPVVASVAQTVYYGLPVTWPAVTLSMVMIYLNVQNHQISLDALTGINNRGHMDRRLMERVSSEQAVGRLRMVLLDVDDFKHINDTYGHAMGDQALCQVAELLKRVCGTEHRRGDFLARYGGDEFVLLVERDSEAEMKQLLTTIRVETDRLNARRVLPCVISLSIGYATLRQEARSAEQLIMAADRRMYDAKRARHRQAPSAAREPVM